MSIPDPLEAQVALALDCAGIKYEKEKAPSHLDFYLPKYGIYIEVKSFHTARTNEQLKREHNVIVLQGATAVAVFCTFLLLSN